MGSRRSWRNCRSRHDQRDHGDVHAGVGGHRWHVGTRQHGCGAHSQRQQLVQRRTVDEPHRRDCRSLCRQLRGSGHDESDRGVCARREHTTVTTNHLPEPDHRRRRVPQVQRLLTGRRHCLLGARFRTGRWHHHTTCHHRRSRCLGSRGTSRHLSRLRPNDAQQSVIAYPESHRSTLDHEHSVARFFHCRADVNHRNLLG